MDFTSAEGPEGGPEDARRRPPPPSPVHLDAGRPRGTFALGRVGGTALRLHFSAIFTLLFFLWIATQRMKMPVLLSLLGGAGAFPNAWTWGAILTGGLLLSMLLHQLAHLLAARAVGYKVRSLTFLLLGGCPCADGLHGRGRRALVAAAGPVASLVVGSILVLLGWKLELRFDLRAALFLMGQVQVFLAVAELLPVPPLDGGRLLAILLERWLGRARAVAAAAHLGRGLALGLGLVGTMMASLPLIAVAAVLWAAASFSLTGEGAVASLHGVSVGDVVEPASTIAAGATLLQAAAQMQEERRASLAAVDDGVLVGVLDAREVSRVPAAARRWTLVGELVRVVPAIAPNQPAGRALAALRALRAEAMPVVDDGELVGLLTRRALEGAAALAALGHAQAALAAAEDRELAAHDLDDAAWQGTLPLPADGPRASRAWKAPTLLPAPAFAYAVTPVLMRRRFRHGTRTVVPRWHLAERADLRGRRRRPHHHRVVLHRR